MTVCECSRLISYELIQMCSEGAVDSGGGHARHALVRLGGAIVCMAVLIIISLVWDLRSSCL